MPICGDFFTISLSLAGRQTRRQILFCPHQQTQPCASSPSWAQQRHQISHDRQVSLSLARRDLQPRIAGGGELLLHQIRSGWYGERNDADAHRNGTHVYRRRQDQETLSAGTHTNMTQHPRIRAMPDLYVRDNARLTDRLLNLPPLHVHTRECRRRPWPLRRQARRLAVRRPASLPPRASPPRPALRPLLRPSSSPSSS